MRRQLLVTSALLACAAAANAQDAILLRVGGTVGQVNRYATVMNMFVLGGPMTQMGGDTSQPFMRMSTFSTRTLASATSDTLAFTEVIDSAHSESPAMPQMSMMMGQAGNALRGQTTSTKMDGRAHIYSVESSNPNNPGMGSGGPGGMGGGPGGGRRGGGMMGGGGNRQRVMYVLPERAVRVGETWSDSTVTPGTGSDGPTSFLATFKLERVDSRGSVRIAVISMDGNMATSSANGPQRLSVTGQFQFDLANSRLASFDMTMTGTSNMQGQDVPTRIVLSQSLIN